MEEPEKKQSLPSLIGELLFKMFVVAPAIVLALGALAIALLYGCIIVGFLLNPPPTGKPPEVQKK